MCGKVWRAVIGAKFTPPLLLAFLRFSSLGHILEVILEANGGPGFEGRQAEVCHWQCLGSGKVLAFYNSLLFPFVSEKQQFSVFAKAGSCCPELSPVFQLMIGRDWRDCHDWV